MALGGRGVRWMCGRVVWPLACARIGRAVKAGRRPPVGEALTARSSARDNGWPSPSGLGGRAVPLLEGGRVRWSSPVPHGVVEDKQAGLGCLVMSSPGPVAGSGMERSGAASSAQSHKTTRLGVMPVSSRSAGCVRADSPLVGLG